MTIAPPNIPSNPQALAVALADARDQRKRWEDREKELLDALLAAHTAGLVPTKFVAAGWTFALQPGRKTVIYPDTITAEIKLLQAKAVADGLTTEKIGSPFWKIVEAKEKT